MKRPIRFDDDCGAPVQGFGIAPPRQPDVTLTALVTGTALAICVSLAICVVLAAAMIGTGTLPSAGAGYTAAVQEPQVRVAKI